MPRFQYRVLRPSGGEVVGELVAVDEHDAALRLQAGGDYPIEITATDMSAGWRGRFSAAATRLSARELTLFTQQLAVLVGAGVALDRALALAGAVHGRKRRARLAGELLAAINRGDSLSRACREHGGLPRHYAMVVAAGEARGDVGDALARLAAVLERSRAASRALAGAIAYPASILVVAAASVSFLLTFVVPRFEALAVSFRHQPPLAMQMLLALSAVFRVAEAPALLLCLLAAGFVAARWRNPAFRNAFDRCLLALPLLGPLLRNIETERLVFLLGTLIAAGVALPTAIAGAAATMTYQSFRGALAAAESAIERGDKLTAALAADRLLPETAIELLRVGEETGNLSAMLLKTSEVLQREIEATSSELIGLITPVSVVFLGLLIGAIAFAIIGTVLDVYDIAG